MSEGEPNSGESDNEEDYRLYCNAAPSHKISQNQIEHKAVWDLWCESNLDSLAKEASKQSVSTEESSLPVEPKGDKNVLNSAREYQLELFERAKAKNIIVVLETGKLD